MDKIRYRLVYNRKKRLNKQGTALVQVEASLNQRKVYFKTNIYLRPEHFDKRKAQVYNHPQANDLNAMLYEFILHLQAIEISFWKHQGVPITTVQKLLGHTSVKTTEIYSEILSNTIVRDLKAVKKKRYVSNFQSASKIR